jgi:hypothetical protein
MAEEFNCFSIDKPACTLFNAHEEHGGIAATAGTSSGYHVRAGACSCTTARAAHIETTVCP